MVVPAMLVRDGDAADDGRRGDEVDGRHCCWRGCCWQVMAVVAVLLRVCAAAAGDAAGVMTPMLGRALRRS